MTNPAGFDFTKFVPGFDFLKNLTPGGGASAASAAPGLAFGAVSSAAPGKASPTPSASATAQRAAPNRGRGFGKTAGDGIGRLLLRLKE